MATPLSPTPSAALNYSTPSSLRHETYENRLYSARNTTPQQSASDNTENNSTTNSDEDSSPFLSHVKDDSVTSPTPRGPSPPKARPGSRIISGHELSPLKILQQQQQNQIQAHTQNQQPQPASDEITSPAAKSMPPPPLPQSPRKAPIKRFPVKVSQPGSVTSESSRRSSRQSLDEHQASAEQQQQQQQQPQQQQEPQQTSLRNSVQESAGLRHAIDIFEDEVDAMHNDAEDADENGDSTLLMDVDMTGQHEQFHEEEHSAADDTMISTFSSFSSFTPNLTMFAQMRSNSPTKFSVGGTTPRATPRPSRMAGQQSAPTPSSNSVAATPQRPGTGNNLVNLLDFDLPPMPTPRSVPTITPRELESLKSRFLSEISSLKASLSGKEAEVLSLKTAVGDAEKRVGQCMEQLREVQGTHESLAAEKDSWERRGREMEAVLRKVKEEIVISQREREELEFKLDESEKRREAAEMMAQEAESKMAGMRAGKASAEAAASNGGGAGGPAVAMTNKEVEIAVTRVARELHGLYKNKHEQKITALKKSYEKRWEKRVRELQDRVEELTREKEELRAREGSSHHNDGLAAARLAELEEAHRAESVRGAAQIRELEAEVEKVEAVLKTVQADNAELRVLLERERVEKGELVMLAEEMMNMQQSFIAPQEEEPAAPVPAPAPPVHHQPAPAAAKTPNRRQSSSAATATRTTPMTAARMSMVEPPTNGNGHHYTNGNTTNNNFRMSTGPNSFRASGLRAPGSSMGLKGPGMESRIGRVAQHERAKSAAVSSGYGGSGMPRPGSGQGLRGGGMGGGNGIMSSIEKMGGYGQYRG